MILILLSIILYVILEFIFLKLYNIIFDLKRKTNIVITTFLFLMFGVLTNITNLFSYFNNEITDKRVIGIVLISHLSFRYIMYSIIFKKIKKNILFTSFLFDILTSFFEVFSKIILNTYNDNIFLYLLLPGSAILFLSVTLYLSYKKDSFASLKKVLLSVKPSAYFLTSVFIFAYLLFISADTSDLSVEFKLFIAKLTFFTIPLIFGLVLKISITSKINEETSIMLENQLKNQVEYYEKINNIYSEFRSFRHDYKNHVLCLRNLIADNCMDEAVEYIDELTKNVDNKQKYYDTGNNMINALLTDKSEKAAANNISISFNGFIPSSGIKNIDLCTIFANAVDNAIEACMKDNSDAKKEITIESKIHKCYYFLIIQNPIFNGVIKDENGNILTSKSDKEHHGFGVSNIKNTVKKYDGHTDIEDNDNIFKLSIDLLLKQEYS